MKLNERDQTTMSGDKALEMALERCPMVTVPGGFAAQLMERLPETRPLPRPSRVSSRVAYVSAAAIAVALLVLVGLNPGEFAAGQGFGFVFEMMLVGELLAVGFWLGTRRAA